MPHCALPYRTTGARYATRCVMLYATLPCVVRHAVSAPCRATCQYHASCVACPPGHADRRPAVAPCAKRPFGLRARARVRTLGVLAAPITRVHGACSHAVLCGDGHQPAMRCYVGDGHQPAVLCCAVQCALWYQVASCFGYYTVCPDHALSPEPTNQLNLLAQPKTELNPEPEPTN